MRELLETLGPWLHLLVGSNHDLPRLAERLKDSDSDVFVVELDGIQMRDLDGMYDGFTLSMAFPEYFGRNGNAFDECINDLDWLGSKGYVVLISNAEQLLADESQEQLSWFLEVMSRAGEEWSIEVRDSWQRPPVPFHCVLQTANEAQADHLLETAHPNIRRLDVGSDVSI